jgi:23S rRNA (uridine2552-2'-O)-methyltransferase
MHCTVRRAFSDRLTTSSRAWLARQRQDPYVRSRLSSQPSYRSRSAYKLLELESKWGAFLSGSDVGAVIDLGAAPGGWSQVVAGKLGWLDLDEKKKEEERRQRRPAPVTKYEGAGAGAPILASSEGRRGRNKMGPDETPPDDNGMLLSKGRGTILALDILPMLPVPGVRTLQMDFLHPSTVSFLGSLLPGGKADVVLSDMAPNISGNSTRDTAKGLEIVEAVVRFAIGVLSPVPAHKGDRRKGVLL